MINYILRRLLYTIPTIFIVTVLVFSLIHLIPGNPVEILYGIAGAPEQIEIVKHQLNLDKPIVVQYYMWIKGIMKGDFGYSLKSGEEIWPIIKKKFIITFTLIITSLLISVFISILLGVLAASKRNTFSDFSIMIFAVVAISIPGFWVALMAMYVFSLKLGVLPSIGYVSFVENFKEALRHLIMPASVLALSRIGYTTRMTRSQMVDVLYQDYIRTARAKGVSETVVLYKHAFKNASIPVITAIGLQLGFLMSGSVIIEKIFLFPGIGLYLVNSISSRDYTAVQAVVLIIASFFIILNLIVDIMYGFLNPKIRYK